MAQEAPRVAFSFGEVSEEVDSGALDFKAPSDYETSGRKITATEDPGEFLAQEAPRVAFSFGEPSDSKTTYVTEEVDSAAPDFKAPSDYKTSGGENAVVDDPGESLVGKE
jgi:hypothetical protein